MLGLLRAVWDSLELFLAVWGCLEVFIAVWGCLRLLQAVLGRVGYLGLFWTAWIVLGSLGLLRAA